jgi:hypothetical protein
MWWIFRNSPRRGYRHPLTFKRNIRRNNHGEEMFYLEVLDEYKDQIRGTYGDYGQILDNFIYPTRNIEYVFHTIMANYQRYGYHAEYAAAAAQLKESADKSWVIIDDDTYRTIEKYNTTL